MKGLLLNYQYGMWDAVLQKIKTNTRRAHKSLVPVNGSKKNPINPDDFELLGVVHTPDGAYARFKPKKGGAIIECRARYQVGEITFLQEPTLNLNGFVTRDEDMIMYQYRDHLGVTETDHFKPLIDKALKSGAKWGNKMFMGEKEARYFVRIKRIEVERLQNISDADCFAEGIRLDEGGYFFLNNGQKVYHKSVQKAYFSLYNIINRNAPANPWVFSYHFELCKKNDE